MGMAEYRPHRSADAGVVMPTMQNPELADAIREERPGLAVLHKTAYARHTLAELGIWPVMLLE